MYKWYPVLIFRIYLVSTILSFPPLPYHVQHVLMALWAHGMSKRDRLERLNRMWEALCKINPSLYTKGCSKEFLSEAVLDNIGFEQLRRGILRDFRLSDDVDYTVDVLLRLLYATSQDHSQEFPMRTPLERELVIRSIAACRGRICMSEQTDFNSCKATWELEICYLLLRPSLPLRSELTFID